MSRRQEFLCCNHYMQSKRMPTFLLTAGDIMCSNDFLKHIMYIENVIIVYDMKCNDLLS